MALLAVSALLATALVAFGLKGLLAVH